MSKYKNLNWRISDFFKDLKRLPLIIKGDQLPIRVMDQVHESGITHYRGAIISQQGYTGYHSIKNQVEQEYDKHGRRISET